MAKAWFAVVVTPSKKKSSHASQSPFFPRRLEQLVIEVPVTLEEKAEIEERLLQGPFHTQEKSDEQAPHPSISIQKGMNGFKLNVRKRGLDQGWASFGLIVQKFLERCSSLTKTRPKLRLTPYP
jgi:hypothetical protein